MSESTPQRPVKARTKGEIQESALEQLAVHDIHDCYFIMDQEHPQKKCSILEALHKEVPKELQVSDIDVEDLLCSLEEKDFWKDQHSDPHQSEKRTTLLLQHSTRNFS